MPQSAGGIGAWVALVRTPAASSPWSWRPERRPVLCGLVRPMAGVRAPSGLLGSLLFGIGPRDTVAFVLAPPLLAAAALIAGGRWDAAR